MMECKKALAETYGDMEKAVEVLRKSGHREGREARRAAPHRRAGSRPTSTTTASACSIEVNCETDFVARTDDFGRAVRDLAMQAAAAGADFVRREEVPAERVAREREIYAAQLAERGQARRTSSTRSSTASSTSSTPRSACSSSRSSRTTRSRSAIW